VATIIGDMISSRGVGVSPAPEIVETAF
jgi:hypothetical protein